MARRSLLQHYSWQYRFNANDRDMLTSAMVERGSNVRWNDDGSLTIWTVLPATGTPGIEPVIDRVYPFGGAIDAFRAMKAGDLFGRIMLDMAA